MPRRLELTEANLSAACRDVLDNDFTAYQAEKKHGVPRKTITLHLNGTTHSTSQKQIQPAARLTAQQEKRVVDFIVRQEKLGYPLSARKVRGIVISMCADGGDFRPLGKNWISSFKNRNPEVATKIGKKQEAARFKAFTPKAVN